MYLLHTVPPEVHVGPKLFIKILYTYTTLTAKGWLLLLWHCFMEYTFSILPFSGNIILFHVYYIFLHNPGTLSTFCCDIQLKGEALVICDIKIPESPIIIGPSMPKVMKSSIQIKTNTIVS